MIAIHGLNQLAPAQTYMDMQPSAGIIGPGGGDRQNRIPLVVDGPMQAPNVGVCSVRCLCVCVSILFLFYYSSSDDGERGTRCARGALAVAHGPSGGDRAHACDPRDVRHAHELDFGDEAPDDRQDLQGCIFDISNKSVLNHSLHERVHWIY